MKIKIEIPFYHGNGDTATEEYAPLVIKVRKKDALKAIKKSVNGYVEKGRLFAGSGDEVIPRFDEIDGLITKEKT